MHSVLRIFALGIVLVMFLPVTGFAGQPPPPQDHLKCYMVKDPLMVNEDVRLFSEQFDITEGCKIIGKERFFCGGVDKMVEPPSTFGRFRNALDRICYRIECPPRQGQKEVPEDVEVDDQFGIRTLTNFNPHYLCTPAFKTGQPCEERAACGGACEGDINGQPAPATCRPGFAIPPQRPPCDCIPDQPCEERASCGGLCRFALSLTTCMTVDDGSLEEDCTCGGIPR